MSGDADSFLVKNNVEDGYNFSIGEPEFLRDVLSFYYPDGQPPMRYTYPHTVPEPQLLNELKALHPEPDTYFVVTNGAKQALHAAVYAFTQLEPIRYNYLCHRTPCWPTHKTVASLNDLLFKDIDTNSGSYNLYVNTTPNNPDGTESIDLCHIWDAAYAHSVYGWSGNTPPHCLSVWSAAKMLGCSGARVGWIVTQDSELAHWAAKYVEATTSGVSINSQIFVAHTLKNLRSSGKLPELYEKARNTLLANQQEALRLAPYFSWSNLNSEPFKGMFAWFTVKNPTLFQKALDKTKIRLLPGWACHSNLEGEYRMSLGQRTTVVREAVDLLLTELQTL